MLATDGLRCRMRRPLILAPHVPRASSANIIHVMTSHTSSRSNVRHANKAVKEQNKKKPQHSCTKGKTHTSIAYSYGRDVLQDTVAPGSATMLTRLSSSSRSLYLQRIGRLLPQVRIPDTPGVQYAADHCAADLDGGGQGVEMLTMLRTCLVRRVL